MKDEENILYCKITLVVDSGVGKSSIKGRFVTEFSFQILIVQQD